MENRKETFLSLKISLKHSDKSGFHLDVNTQIPLQGVTAIFGKSGSGKTSLLRCIAGLEPKAKGTLTFADEIWLDEKKHTNTEKRNIGYIFQEGALFDHLNVRKNMEYAKNRTVDLPSDITFESVVSLLNLENLLERKPHQLSGGERQRVAIARALLSQPRLLLMDEPLASLDSKHKSDILPYLEKLESNYNIPIIYVSHSLDEVFRLAKHIILIEEGKVLAQGLTHEILSRPEHIGIQGDSVSSMLFTTAIERDSMWNMTRLLIGNTSVEYEQNTEHASVLHVADSNIDLGSTIRIQVLAKDVSIALEDNENSSILNRIPATIAKIIDDTHPAMRIVQLTVANQKIFARITRQSENILHLKEGYQVWAQIKSVALIR